MSDEPEPAEGQVPAGDYTPVVEESPEPAEGQVPAGDYIPVPEEIPEPEATQENGLKSTEEVAREVIAGQWGRGLNRKQRLQDAGYDVAAVSAEITHILNG